MKSKKNDRENGMMEVLMECHERELMRRPPLNDATRYMKNLYLKDFVERRSINGNGEMGYFITEKGKKALEEYLKSSDGDGHGE
jgi:predicted transcriptional regulator